MSVVRVGRVGIEEECLVAGPTSEVEVGRRVELEDGGSKRPDPVQTIIHISTGWLIYVHVHVYTCMQAYVCVDSNYTTVVWHKLSSIPLQIQVQGSFLQNGVASVGT